jgi:hypothetical protein
LLFAPASRAVISEPDNRVWGSVLLGGLAVTAADTNIVVEARRSLTDPPLASYRMGASRAAGDFYSLAIPVESVAPQTDADATQTGETILILVHNGQFIRYLTLYTVGTRGKVTRIDLGDIDSDSNGLVDNWERQYFGASGQDPNGDPDRDGVNNRNEMLGGTNPQLADARHPADTSPTNNVITINEVTAYALAWKTGQSWPVAPTNIPVDFVARAGFLWKNGEGYIMDTNNLAAGAPLWWTNLPPAQVAGNTARVGLAGVSGRVRTGGTASLTSGPIEVRNTVGRGNSVTRSFNNDADGLPGVRLAVVPEAYVSAYVVEESVPSGRSVSQISDEGVFDGSSGKVRWGPFFDDSPRDLRYELQPPLPNSERGNLLGLASFDGVNVETSGDDRFAERTEVRWKPPQFNVTGELILRFSGETGLAYEIEVSEDLVTWTPGGSPRDDGAGGLEFRDRTLPGQRFYRVRRMEP